MARYSGRIVKLMGDGALVEFASVVDAVDCAMAIQTAAAGGGAALALRIGVNLGDIILQGDDIYGDGVNIAARLELLAEPGGICVSSAVHESIRARVDATFSDGGAVEVKNIDRPVRIWRWHPGAAGALPKVAEPARKPEGPSVAVLAFTNMSGEPEQEYFADGIAEDIITDLSKVSGLTVIARNSSFVYKGRSVDLRHVGRELGVAYVLEGSVRLTPSERAGITASGTTSPEAHESLMKMRALHFSPSLNKAMWERAVAHGRRAIELDPGYAEARAVWADLMRIDPGFDIRARLSRFGYIRPEDPALMVEGLARASVPAGA